MTLGVELKMAIVDVISELLPPPPGITRSAGKVALLGNGVPLHTSLVVVARDHTFSCSHCTSQNRLCFQRFSSLKGI